MSTCPRRALVLCLLILATAAAAAGQGTVQFPYQEVWSHRTRPAQSIHSDHFDSRSIFLHDSVTLDVIVGTDGHVESAHAVEGPQEFYVEAETIERDEKFKPFEKDGVPVRAAIKDHVRLAPPEKWSARVLFPETKDWASLRMTLSRTTCYGACPAYSVEVRGDGTVIYHGTAFVLITGEHHSQIPKKQVQELFARFRGADFFSLKDEYRAGITDNPTEKTSIEFDGRRKQVVDYVGHYVGMPDAVGELEQTFDQLAGTEKWVKETSETWHSLVAEHWDFKSKTAENGELFASVIAHGSDELIGRFTSAGAPAFMISKTIYGRQTALESAAAKGDTDLVRRMLATRENIPSPVMYQTLRAAASKGSLELVRLLIDRGADLNGAPADPKDPQTVLMAAAQSGKADVVKEILLHRPDVNAKSYTGETALTMFLERGGEHEGAEEIVKALISYGADLRQVDEQGRTPLFAACSTPQAVKLLVASGADVNAKDRGGQTALINCSYRKDFVAAMLAAGADPSLRDHYGHTAVERARQMGSKDAADLLEAAIRKRASQ